MSGLKPAPAARLTSATGNPERRPDLDWLRTLIVLAIIPYHALVLYTVTSGTVIRHPTAAPWAPPLYRLLEEWGILVIFLLSGAGSAFALRSRSLPAYAWERVLRLAVPLALVAVLFAPVRAYYLALNNPGLLSVSPVPITDPARMRNAGAFFLEYWRILFTTGSSIVSRNPIAHLWFVPRLIEVTLLGAPVIWALRGRWPRWMERLSARGVPLPGLLLGAGLIPAALALILEPGWLNRLLAAYPLAEDWVEVALGLCWFLAGALIYTSSGLRQAVGELAYPALALALAGLIATLGVTLSSHAPEVDYPVGSLLPTVTRVVSLWLLTLGLLGLGIRFLSVTTAWQPYLTAAAFPVYLLHLPLLLPAAYYLQYLPLVWPLQMALAVAIVVAGSFALYEFAVRRAPGVGVLFGIPHSPPISARPPEAPGAPVAPGGRVRHPARSARSPGKPPARPVRRVRQSARRA